MEKTRRHVLFASNFGVDEAFTELKDCISLTDSLLLNDDKDI
jgi:hypothetical protein